MRKKWLKLREFSLIFARFLLLNGPPWIFCSMSNGSSIKMSNFFPKRSSFHLKPFGW